MLIEAATMEVPLDSSSNWKSNTYPIAVILVLRYAVMVSNNNSMLCTPYHGWIA